MHGRRRDAAAAREGGAVKFVGLLPVKEISLVTLRVLEHWSIAPQQPANTPAA
jgi:hypothetical protein